MSWWSKAKSYVSSKISRKKTVVKQSVVSAPTRSVKVTDYVGGGSKTTSSYTPGTTTRATGGGSSGGGGSSAPVQLDIEPQGISPEQGEQYREEEQDLYKRTGYQGGISYNVPATGGKITAENIQEAKQNSAYLVPTDREGRKQLQAYEQQQLQPSPQEQLNRKVKRYKEGEFYKSDFLVPSKSGGNFSWGEFAKTGNLPYSPIHSAIKTSMTFGEIISAKTGFSDKIKGTWMGTPVSGDKQVKFYGDVSTGVFFGPAMQTGTLSKQLQKTLSKNQFEKLEEFYGGVEREVVKKGTTVEQLKVIQKVQKEFGLSDDATKGLIKSLKNKGIIKEPVLKLFIDSSGKLIIETPRVLPPKPKLEITGIIDIQLPQTMKGAGLITGGMNPPKILDQKLKNPKQKVQLETQQKIKLDHQMKVYGNWIIGQKPLIYSDIKSGTKLKTPTRVAVAPPKTIPDMKIPTPQIMKTPSPTRPNNIRPYTPRPTNPGKFLIPFIPRLRLDLPRSRSGRYQTSSRIFGYTPSFTALKLGITGEKTKKGKLGYTGFEVRNIIKPKTTKKTTKKKRVSKKKVSKKKK